MGGHPHAWPLSLGPELHREAQGRGARGWALGRPHSAASLGRPLEITESGPPSLPLLARGGN